jgi:Outer membrane lipoprotein-sorting protein
MNQRKRTLIALLCTSVVAGAAAPAAAKLTPRQIVERSMDQQVFRNKGAEMKIELRLANKRGEKKHRLLAASTLRQGGLSHTMARVLAPQDVAGMAFLFKQRKNGADEQFMYLAALRVTKRIVGAQKSAKFLGSQFTYGDLEWRSVENARYKRLPDEKVGAAPCHVIEALPGSGSDYGKLTLWIRAKDFTLVRMKFFDKEQRLKKVLFVKRVEQIGGRLVATRMKMKNVQTGDATLLAVSEVKLRNDLSPDRFTVRQLKQQ